MRLQTHITMRIAATIKPLPMVNRYELARWLGDVSALRDGSDMVVDISEKQAVEVKTDSRATSSTPIVPLMFVVKHAEAEVLR